MPLSSPQATAIFRAGIEARLIEILEAMPPEWLDRPMVFQVNKNGVKACLHIGKLSDETPAVAVDTHGRKLTRCQRDVVMVLRVESARKGGRVVGAEIRAAMKAAGLQWSASSINVALADLVADGLITNAHDKSGYAPRAAEGDPGENDMKTT